jgi:hypothetical protein
LVSVTGVSTSMTSLDAGLKNKAMNDMSNLKTQSVAERHRPAGRHE